jgi:allantoin racemase
MRIKQIVPFPLGEDDLALRAEQAPRDVLHAGTEIETVAVRNSFRTDGPNVGTSYYEWALLETYVVEAGLSAEDEGFDAVVVDTTTDSGVRTLRSRLTIPVVGAGMTAYAIAMLLGTRFSIITYTPDHTFLVEDSLRSYDLTGRCASIRNVGVAPVLENATDAAKEREARLFVQEGRRAMEEDGAHVLLVASTTMHRQARAMQRELSVPVVDPGPTAIALAEMLAGLGLAHSKAAYPSPASPQDELFFALPSALPRPPDAGE